MIRYRGSQYREAAPAAVVDDAYWRHESLVFWIYAVVESKMVSDLPAKAKRLTAKTWDKVPFEIRNGVGQDADTQERILDSIDRGMCHYIVIEGAGWAPGAKKGAKDVATVQATLEWIERFRNRSAPGGSSLIWAEINSQVRRPK